MLYVSDDGHGSTSTARPPLRFVAVIAVFAWAAGGSAPAPAATGELGGGRPSPCRLLTQEEVAELLDEPVGKGRPDSAPGARECEWAARAEGTGGIESAPLGVTVTLHTKARALREFSELVRDQDNDIIDGVGDEAFAGEFATPVVGRVGKQVFEVDLDNYDTSKWDGDPRQIVVDAGEIVGERLARAAGRDLDDEPRQEQPVGVPARFPDDIPVPASFEFRTVFGTEYDGSGAFGGDLSVEETVAYFEDALDDAGFTVGEPRSETEDGVPTTVVPFEGHGRTGEVAVSPNDDPPGATLVFITYESPEA